MNTPQLSAPQCCPLFGALLFSATLCFNHTTFAQALWKSTTNAPTSQRWHSVVLDIVDADTDEQISELMNITQKLGWVGEGDTNYFTFGIGAFDKFSKNPISIKAVIKKFGEPTKKTQIAKTEKIRGETKKVDYDIYSYDGRIFMETIRDQDEVDFFTAPASWLRAGIRKIALKETEKSKRKDPWDWNLR